ncbi:trypsin inhibitor-like [Prosopis cineraria]|uniref:trypsin inhibitor-like n=1 Tax=Prosopis cineraria TaxID=364024 RepID=UPI00240F7CEB|nr:trypsin inhibitor-like [Prosopis cineraria]
MATVLRLHALIIFSLFLFAFSISTLAHDLRDVNGDPLYNGGLYYIFPVYTGNGGGLELARTGRDTCPRTVVKSSSDTSKGLPARLASPSTSLTLRSDFLLTIEFQLENPSICYRGSRLQWKVEGESQTVKIASSKDEEEVFTGPFKIQPYRGFYKLVYCPVYPYNGREWCTDLGISMDDQKNRRLVVKDGEPLKVCFIKADRRGDEEDEDLDE